MTAEPNVESASADIQASAVNTIVLGFAADPITRWVWPDSSEYLRIMPQFVKAFGGRAFEHGTAYITEGTRAAALWLPPGVEPDEEAMGEVVAQALRPEIADDMQFMFKGMAEHHPHEPHWYLPLIAADPNWIGQGLGTLLMKHAATWRASAPISKARIRAIFPFMNATASESSVRYSTVLHRR